MEGPVRSVLTIARRGTVTSPAGVRGRALEETIDKHSLGIRAVGAACWVKFSARCHSSIVALFSLFSAGAGRQRKGAVGQTAPEEEREGCSHAPFSVIYERVDIKVPTSRRPRSARTGQRAFRAVRAAFRWPPCAIGTYGRVIMCGDAAVVAHSPRVIPARRRGLR